MKRIVLFLMILVTAFAGAQEDRGRINGLVLDPSGAIVPKATVTLLNEDTHVAKTISTDQGGQYVFEYVLPGVYTVSIASPGFKKYVSTHVRMEVGGRVGINANLSVGDQTDQVTVQGTGGARLHTEDATLGFTIEGRSAQELPLQYSSPFELQLLAPGVNSTTLNSATHTYEAGPESAKLNGSQSGQTEFTLDGAPDTRNGGAVTVAYTPSKDFLGEFKMVTSPYDATASHTSGGSLDASLKSGTTKYHGGASFYQQPGAVDAPAFVFAATKRGLAPVAKYNRATGEVDGPVPFIHRLFFMGGYEHQYNSAAASASAQTVPTVAEKTNGDYSALLAAGIGQTVTTTVRCTIAGTTYYAAPYNSYQIFNPNSVTPDPNCPGQYLRAAVPNNDLRNIPGYVEDPVAKNIMAFYPDPTPGLGTSNGQNNFLSPVANVDKYWSAVLRLDYDLSETQKFFVHLIKSHRIQPKKNAYFPGASGQDLVLNNQDIALDYVNTLTPTWVLNARFSFSRFFTAVQLSSPTTAADLGVNPNILAGTNPAASGFPYVKATGYSTLGNSDPSFEADNTPLGLIAVSKSLNRHQLRFGVEWRQYQANQANLTGEHPTLGSAGLYTKGPILTGGTSAPIGQALASLQLGLADSTSVTLNAATANNSNYWSAYIQDDWKATPKLTFNVGLRYEYGSPLWERHNKSAAEFAFGTANPIAPTAISNYNAHPATYTNYLGQTVSVLPAASFQVNGGLVYAGTPGHPSQNLWTTQKLNFSPRVGFAYNPIPKLVVRGGFGLFFSQIAEYAQYGSPIGFTQTSNTIESLDNGLHFIASLQNPFPSGTVAPSGNANGLQQGLNTSLSNNFFVQHPKNPYNERFSLGFQYQLPGDIILDVDYVGSLGYHIRITRDFDALPDSYLSRDTTRTLAQQDLYKELFSTNFTSPFSGITIPGSTYNSTITGSQLLKPYPEFSGITASDPAGSSNYNAFQASVAKRFSHGYNLTVSYSKSRAMDAITFLNAGDAKPWYGVSNGDYPQSLAVASIYELPFGHNKPFLSHIPEWADLIIRGFQVQGLYRIQSGQPLTFSNAGAILAPGATYADIGKNTAKTYQNWFNTQAIVNARPTTLTPGPTNSTGGVNYANSVLEANLRTFPLRFNNVRQDYQNNLNVGAIKKFIVRDRYNLTLRAEAFNLLNHHIFSNPSTDPSATTFGAVTGYGNTARVLQFALEIHF